MLDKITWAQKWGVPLAALYELNQISMAPTLGVIGGLKTEEDAKSMCRIVAQSKGVTLFRNNVGAFFDQRGNRMVRFGLANESAKQNLHFKSSDLIGIGVDGRFVAREIKKPGWKYSGAPHEKAQKNFIDWVNMRGGDAAFSTGDF